MLPPKKGLPESEPPLPKGRWIFVCKANKKTEGFILNGRTQVRPCGVTIELTAPTVGADIIRPFLIFAQFICVVVNIDAHFVIEINIKSEGKKSVKNEDYVSEKKSFKNHKAKKRKANGRPEKT